MELLPQFLDLAVHADDERFLLQTGLLRRVKTLHSLFGDDFHFSSSFKGAKSPSPRGDGRYAVVPPCFIRSPSAKRCLKTNLANAVTLRCAFVREAVFISRRTRGLQQAPRSLGSKREITLLRLHEG